MAVWPDTQDLSEHLNSPFGQSDQETVNAAVLAANSALQARTIYTDADDIPEELKFAAVLLAAKLYGRRHTPDGVSSNEFGDFRVNRFDGDVETLTRPYLSAPIG